MKNVCSNILLKFSDSSDEKTGYKEWVFKDDVIFNNPGPCQCCSKSQEKIRYKINNMINENCLVICDDCLMRLHNCGIEYIDSESNRRNIDTLADFIDDCRHILKKEDEKIEVLKYLNNLNSITYIGITMKEFEAKGYFRIEDALRLIDKFEVYALDYDRTMFKIKINCKSEKERFLNLNEEDYMLLFHSLSPYQRKIYEENNEMSSI